MSRCASVTAPHHGAVGLGGCWGRQPRRQRVDGRLPGARGAGAAGRGLYRLHQFSKVELFVVSTPEQSEALLGELSAFEEALFTDLGLHFKVLVRPRAPRPSASSLTVDLLHCAAASRAPRALSEPERVCAGLESVPRGRRCGTFSSCIASEEECQCGLQTSCIFYGPSRLSMPDM